ncbi:MAG: GDSL-type esterase/lipase family protein [Vicinamibacterales bacterium]
MRRVLGRILVFITLLSVSLIAAEGALRLAGYWPALSSEWMLYADSRTADQDLISIDRRFLDEATYTPFQVAAPTKLIVALGDSYTAGVPVTAEEAYPGALERILTADSRDIRVMNAGLGDSGPEQQLALLTKYVLPRVHPDVVIWQFYANDSIDNAMKALFSVSPEGALVPLAARDNWMYRRQRFYERVPLPEAVKSGSYVFHLLLRRYEVGRSDAVPKGTDPTAWGRQKIPLNIIRMTELAKQHGFELYLTLVAPQATYESVEPNTPAYQEAMEYPKVLELLESQPNFIHVKFDAVKMEQARSRGEGIFSDGTRDPNPFGMRHFNAAGYAMMAQTIADGIQRQQFPVQAVAPVSHMTFGQSAARRWMRNGWYQDEVIGAESYVWSEGETSVLELPLPEGKDLKMTFECQPLRFPGNPQQAVTIVLNGTVIEKVLLGSDAGAYSVVLPKAAIHQPLNTLEFRYGYARRSMDVQPGSTDTRTLAVAWHLIDFAGIDRP